MRFIHPPVPRVGARPVRSSRPDATSIVRQIVLAGAWVLLPATVVAQIEPGMRDASWAREPVVLESQIVDGCPPSRVEVKTDRFSGVTGVSSPFNAGASVGNLQPLLLAEIRPTGLVMHLTLLGAFDSCRYLKCYQSFLLANGKPVKVSKVDHDGDVHRSGVTETILLHLDMSSLAQLAAANVVEWKVCTDEFKAEQGFVCDIRDFYAEMRKLVDASKE